LPETKNDTRDANRYQHPPAEMRPWRWRIFWGGQAIEGVCCWIIFSGFIITFSVE
jgi:hypothetical protein